MTTIEWRSPRISLQRANRSSLVDGQFGTGVLVKEDIVLLTEATAAVLLGNDPPRADVILGPHTVDGDAVIERRGITWLQPLQLSGPAPDGRETRPPLAFAGLDAPSVYTPAARHGIADRLELALPQSNDAWAALVIAGMIPPGDQQPPDNKWLRAVENLLDTRLPIVRPLRTQRTPACNAIFFWLC